MDSAQKESSESQLLENEIDKDDVLKLLSLFEDMVVLLKDDPENKVKIRTIWNRIMNGYGHIEPISQILKSVERSFL